jgi:hypothetical protein
LASRCCLNRSNSSPIVPAFTSCSRNNQTLLHSPF